MKTKYTPGPWEADGYYIRQKSTGTRMIADICYTGPHHTPPDEYPESCRLIDEDNARLIAAAPELLEALEETLAEMESLMKSKETIYQGGINISNRAKAAIAKAKGETP